MIVVVVMLLLEEERNRRKRKRKRKRTRRSCPTLIITLAITGRPIATLLGTKQLKANQINLTTIGTPDGF